MCFAAAGLPAIIGAISTAASVAGTAVGVAGTMAQADAQAEAATFRQKQERMLAEDALARGAQQEQAQRRKTAALMGRQRAVMAASNVSLASGSPLAILGDTAALGELDAQVIRDNARRQENYHSTNATLAGMEADNARTAGAWQAFGTALGGASALADKWYKPSSPLT
jgi:hypothetical protein